MRERNKKNSATIQNEEHTNHNMESDEENTHESEQEGSNSDDGNALVSKQEEQNSAVSARANSVRRQVKEALRGFMAGLGDNPVQVFATCRDLHWEFLRLWTGFELPSSCVNLP